jgi:hypothetical protein
MAATLTISVESGLGLIMNGNYGDNLYGHTTRDSVTTFGILHKSEDC